MPVYTTEVVEHSAPLEPLVDAALHDCESPLQSRGESIERESIRTMSTSPKARVSVAIAGIVSTLATASGDASAAVIDALDSAVIGTLDRPPGCEYKRPP